MKFGCKNHARDWRKTTIGFTRYIREWLAVGQVRRKRSRLRLAVSLGVSQVPRRWEVPLAQLLNNFLFQSETLHEDLVLIRDVRNKHLHIDTRVECLPSSLNVECRTVLLAHRELLKEKKIGEVQTKRRKVSLSHGLPRNIDAGVSWDRCNLANVSPDCQAFLRAGRAASVPAPRAELSKRSYKPQCNSTPNNYFRIKYDATLR
ncbi:hypothetical protein DBV15_08123 [Temnothorax longispinosus]|uniref:Uncharacterized protein n=1 Tax=Temnothorax longispinosus TaxID=300112 RepID=A0A4S2KLT7_9HYME|nr:hypothetical protein DBV15_08123 [Temnothorax longispinosus]